MHLLEHPLHKKYKLSSILYKSRVLPPSIHAIVSSGYLYISLSTNAPYYFSNTKLKQYTYNDTSRVSKLMIITDIGILYQVTYLTCYINYNVVEYLN